ncbi:tRNA 2-selenouridine(34) synthase MnmH [Caldisalinibacter kiritimatiensis]|uniref:Selenophosphate-dependent tRNA 2-selenouridine synthase n=1 Tax=Caldisalinibacter kiritimatiensis TaxID=1304284 RepID=R1AX46_9FIRM|nr:tRNA 2-selenouridine(34) synthase MnmH [Caldisalinibacter kiritimatiensis]EOD01242.1 Selenophosphate-dependent tRNA 2-selenouridine synthase [Caldisalinibacter kiritimatiensis]
MIKKVGIDEILKKRNVEFIDVRSEKEFCADTIPGAINLPILNDREREKIGYLYKQVDKEKAKEKGIEYASSKLSVIYKKVREIKEKNKDIALFCYRGGMRSNSVASVLNTMGIDVYLIEGGYKAYRKYVVENLDYHINRLNFIVLHGYTGVGKTKILRILKNRNEPIIDLELLAKNKGSVFGNIGYNDSCVTQKNFETKLFWALMNIKTNYVFIESESKRIGKILLPEKLYNKMEKGTHVLLKTTLENRIQNISDDYLNDNIFKEKSTIIKAINKLRKRLSNKLVDELIKKIKDDEYNYVIEKLMLHYYDPLYKYSIDKVNKYDKIIEYKEINKCVEELIFYKRYIVI